LHPSFGDERRWNKRIGHQDTGLPWKL